MTREDQITEERVNNLCDALIAVLNSDTTSTPRAQFDPFDHVTALSMVLCAVSLRLGVTKDIFMTAMDQCYDVTQTRLEIPNETNH